MDRVNFSELLPLLARLMEDPEAMKAISGLMGAMNGQKSEAQTGGRAQADPLASLLTALGTQSAQGRSEVCKNGTPEGNDVTRNLLNALGGEQTRGNGGGGIGKIFGTQEEMKNRILLLNAVRPYLSEARREKLETVIKLLKLAELGTLGTLLK